MIGGNASSRRAEEFDAALSGRASDAAADRYADLLDVVGAMRAVPGPTARPAFVADLRERLMTEAAGMPAPATRTDDATALRLTPKQRRGSRERRIAAVLGGFAVVAATGSMAMASQSSLPGDVLYPVKRAIENAHANIQTSPDGKAQVLLQNADTRLSEVEQLTQRHDPGDAGEISSTLQAFQDQTNQASAIAITDFSTDGDQSALTDVRTFATSSMARLTALDDVLPTAARPALIAAAHTVQSVDSAAYGACPTCSESKLAPLPQFATKPLSATLRQALLGTDPAATQSQAAGVPLGGDDPTAIAPQQDPSKSPSGTSQGTDPLPSLPSIPLPSSSGDGTVGTKHQGLITGTVTKLTHDLLGSGDSNSGSSGSGGSGSNSTQGTDPTTDSKSPTVVGALTGLLGLNN
ncbi:MAG: DUF5667 domain-containing protein [Nocardioidaceae bacterium]|nr:DUF5667 domain-containing protein [Nocardioidaceae bacterium]MCL2614420.1 DUF5667 domain-containing protein [Nocardioidaceae bacterium]